MATSSKKTPPSAAAPSVVKPPSRKPAAKPKAASNAAATTQKPTRPKTRIAVPSATPKASAPPQPSPTKQAQLINLLRTQAGASMAQMTALTGWQQHTVRGTISATLRKKLGLDVACDSRSKDGARLYRITSPAP